MSAVFWFVFAVVILFGFVVFLGAPYVPSKKRDLIPALSELYPIGPNDTLVDIGSGDGIVLREASRRGATAVGYELNPVLVLVSRFLSRKDSRVSVHLANFWRAQLPESTTVVYTFGDSRDIKKMADKVEETAGRASRPIMFISYAIPVPGRTATKQVGPHFLYLVQPLQQDKA